MNFIKVVTLQFIKKLLKKNIDFIWRGILHFKQDLSGLLKRP